MKITSMNGGIMLRNGKPTPKTIFEKKFFAKRNTMEQKIRDHATKKVHI